MVVSVHQPNYIPWIGYFYKIAKSDLFVFLDDVQYIRSGFINRNRIKTHQGVSWLTVPVDNKGKYARNINEMNMRNDLNWMDNHLKTIEMNYKKSGYFNDFYGIFRDLLAKGHDKLYELNIDIIKTLCGLFDIRTEMILSSELGIKETGEERILQLCRLLGADEYLSGAGGANYQDEKRFEESAIKLTYSNFHEKPYRQLWGDFAGGLSVLDYVFNCGFTIKNAWEA